MQYYAYGRLYLKHKEDIHNPLRFQGQYFDAESGLHYNRHRYYNPNNGRFITADPIGLAGGLNNYQYVKNPTGYVDPLGLANESVNGICCIRVPKEQMAVFQEFKKHHSNMFKNEAELVDAYETLRDKKSPWPIGYIPKRRTIDVGEELYMITNTRRGNYPGQFASLEDIPDAVFGREKLAIIEDWKPTLDRKVKYQVQKPFEVEYGPVGPQINKLANGEYSYLPGGGQQVKLLYNDYKNAVATPENSFTKDAYLKVISNTKLPKVKK